MSLHVNEFSTLEESKIPITLGNFVVACGKSCIFLEDDMLYSRVAH